MERYYQNALYFFSESDKVTKAPVRIYENNGQIEGIVLGNEFGEQHRGEVVLDILVPLDDEIVIVSETSAASELKSFKGKWER